jgi:hypothetical protein
MDVPTGDGRERTTSLGSGGKLAQPVREPHLGLVVSAAAVPVVLEAEVVKSEAGADGILVKVRGRNFFPGAVVRWNGKDLDTTYVSSGELRAILPSTLAAAPATGNITVINPEPTRRESFPFELALR